MLPAPFFNVSGDPGGWCSGSKKVARAGFLKLFLVVLGDYPENRQIMCKFYLENYKLNLIHFGG